MAREIDGILIEDGFDIPPMPEKNPYRKVVDKMKIGESFLVFGERAIYQARNATRNGRRDGKMFRGKKDNEPGFYRVWRVK